MQKAKHAFGMLENVDSAISSGKIDAYDIIFAKDANGKPYVGWVDKDGQKEIVDPYAEVAKLETQVNAEMVTKANAVEVEEKLGKKADADDVEAKIETVKAYTDVKVEAALAEHLVKKYEITNKPVGTRVDYFDKEIRVLCPANTVWSKQAVGETGNANMHYMGFKAYAPEGAVGFKEEYFDFSGDFAGTDEFGRNYSIVWLALASYDEVSGTWTYFGKNSSTERYIGWTYCVEWYDANGVVIESDAVRISLSNEECHNTVEPYYVGSMRKEIDTKIEEKIAEVEGAIEIVEF